MRGIFIEQFEPSRVALPPPQPYSTTNDYERWTKYLDNDIQTMIFNDFENGFAEPIITAIQSEKELPKPTSYCKKGKYPEILKRMHKSGLTGWRLE